MNKESQASMNIRYLKDVARRLDVENVANHVLNDPRFFIWSGSGKQGQHHYGKHGLVIHTAEVVRLCITNDRDMGYNIDARELYLSALFHDCGKMWDYMAASEFISENDTTKTYGFTYDIWSKTDHNRKIHHISRSVIEWTKASLLVLPIELIDNVTHAILAHHGQRAWGSPVAPKTALAWMLHLCDGISARMNDCDTWDPYSGK